MNADGQLSSEELFTTRRMSASETRGGEDDSEGLYDVTANIVESWRNIAVEHGWSYDDLTQNRALWEPLCGDGMTDNGLDSIEGARGVSSDTLERISAFCEGYAQWQAVELLEYDIVQEEDVLSGKTEYQEFVKGISGLSKDRQLKQLVGALEKALDQYNEARVTDIVGYLAFTELVSSPELSSAPIDATNELSYNLQSVLATSSIIMCEHIGGCGPDHPIVFRLCAQIVNRMCLSPKDVYDAASQLLTGLEAELVVDLLTKIDHLRVRY